ncbi:MAG: hypothetical protein N838_26995 [Thiohalocapsa sp. PB-PSB1]|nr:MAG: hypothetical protein N838_26995 [Thiohalocapsa sp. PB-PSB1]
MAIEAIQCDRRIIVAGLTELMFCVDWQWLMIVIVTNMTANATGHAVFSRADATIHGGIALVPDQFHVIPAHVLGRLNTVIERRGLGRFQDKPPDILGLTG